MSYRAKIEQYPCASLQAYFSLTNGEFRAFGHLSRSTAFTGQKWRFEQTGEKTHIPLAGLLIGMLFGAFAPRSSFCLRSALVEFWNHQCQENAWGLFAFSPAMTRLSTIAG